MVLVAPMDADSLATRHCAQAERVKRAIDSRSNLDGGGFKLPSGQIIPLGHRMALRHAILRSLDPRALFLLDALVRLGPMALRERRALGFMSTAERLLIENGYASEGPTRMCVASGKEMPTMRAEPRTSDGLDEFPRSLSSLPPSLEDVGAYLAWISAIGDAEEALKGDRSDGSSESTALTSYFIATEQGWSCDVGKTPSKRGIRVAVEELRTSANKTSCRVGDFPGAAQVLSWLKDQEKLPARLVLWPELHDADSAPAPESSESEREASETKATS